MISRLHTTVVLSLLGVFAVSGCTDAPAPVPTETMAVGGGSADSEAPSGDTPAGAAGGSDAFERAASDDMPALPLSGCSQLDDYEYSSNSGRSFWHFTFTCTDRAAYDATGADLVAAGYASDPLVISSDGYISERNFLSADANGGYTEVQLDMTGSDDELEFEIYVTITLP